MALSFSTSFKEFLKIGIINLNHAKTANAQLNHDLGHLGCDLVGLNEPYYTNLGISDFSRDAVIFSVNDRPRAETLINNSDLCLSPNIVKRDLISISIQWNTVEFIYICIYCPPSSSISDYLNELNLNNLMIKILSFQGISMQKVSYGEKQVRWSGSRVN